MAVPPNAGRVLGYDHRTTARVFFVIPNPANPEADAVLTDQASFLHVIPAWGRLDIIISAGVWIASPSLGANDPGFPLSRE